MVFEKKLEYIPQLRDQYLPCSCCSTTCSPTTFYLQLFFSSLSSSLLCSTYTLQIVVVLSQEFQLKDVGQVRLEHIYIVLNWQLIKSNMINWANCAKEHFWTNSCEQQLAHWLPSGFRDRAKTSSSRLPCSLRLPSCAKNSSAFSPFLSFILNFYGLDSSCGRHPQVVLCIAASGW